MKHVSSKPVKKRAARAAITSSHDVMAQMQEQKHLLELQNEQLCEAHADLELSRHRYADLYNLAPMGYLTLDAKGCIHEVNQTAAELLGYSSTHLVGKPLIPYLAQPDRRVFLKHLWQCQREKDEQSVTLRLLHKGEIERQVEFTTRPAKGFESRPGWCRSAIIDVTERRRTEAALNASEAKFRLLAENMGEVFWFMDLDPPRVTYVSPAFERLWGVPAADLYANHERWEQSVHPDDLASLHEAFHHWTSGKTKTFHAEYRVVDHQGYVHWLADRGIVIGHNNGKPHQISGIARDITERKQTEQALRESEERFRLMADSAPVLIWISDTTKACTWFNQRWTDFTGRTLEQELDDGWAKGVHAEDLDRCVATYVSAFDARQPFEMDYRLRHHDGEWRWVLDCGTPRFAPDSTFLGYIGSCVDITERKAAETELQLRFAELNAKNDELERFNRAMIGREVRMIELKKEINDLSVQAGRPPRHALDFNSR